jgi:hypothetical protein
MNPFIKHLEPFCEIVREEKDGKIIERKIIKADTVISERVIDIKVEKEKLDAKIAELTAQKVELESINISEEIK